MTEKAKQPFSSCMYTVNIYFGLFSSVTITGVRRSGWCQPIDRKAAAESGTLRRDLKEASQHCEG